MKVKSARRIVARKLGVGTSRVKVNPDLASKVKEAITGLDLENLCREKVFVKSKKNAQSRGRARVLHIKKQKGRRKGQGSRKGSKNSRINFHALWITKVRSQRKYLRLLLADKKISNKQYRDLYNKIKGGFFRSKAHIDLHLEKK